MTVELPGSAAEDSTAIYIHWPFCAKKCPYCDFNSHVREKIDQKAWEQAYLRELDTLKALYPNLKARSIFFGGGTPSLMDPSTTAALIERVRTHWGGGESLEITLEANPSSVEAGRFKGYREAGVNRLSLGVQSFDDTALSFLGRLHSADAARTALEIARSTFDRVSFDLIYARPDHIDAAGAWKAELAEALAYSPSHLSLYQLTIEENTAFKLQYERGKFALPDEDEAVALFELTQDMTSANSLPAYEVSNHARAGEESQHNLAYWEGRPYFGVGPGAHGRLPHAGGALATTMMKRPEEWLTAVDQTGHGLMETEVVRAEDRAVEAVMMGLRLMKGLDLADTSKRLGTPLEALLDMGAVAGLVEDEYLTLDGDVLALTKQGIPLLNALLPRILKP